MDLKADYELNFVRSWWYRFFPRTRERLKRWLILDSPIWVQNYLKRRYRAWYVENTLCYILEDEIRKKIDDEIVREIQKAMKNEIDIR